VLNKIEKKSLIIPVKKEEEKIAHISTFIGGI
jgi:hypothetical protein